MTSSAGAAAESCFTVRLPFGPGAARTARAMVRGLLAGFAPSERLLEDVELVVHELVVNGVVHGRPDENGTLELTCEVHPGEVVVGVRDHGTDGSVAVKERSEDGMSGRGLAIIEAIAASWSVDRSDGTRVTARIDR